METAVNTKLLRTETRRDTSLSDRGMEESMEAENFEIADDHNHNNTWEASPSTYELPQNPHPEKTQFLLGSSVLGTQTPPEEPQAGSLSGIPIPDPADSGSDPPTAGKLPLNMNNTTSRFCKS